MLLSIHAFEIINEEDNLNYMIFLKMFYFSICSISFTFVFIDRLIKGCELRSSDIFN